MSAPWTFDLDREGPCNGDVLVKTDKGRLVALIFSTGDDAKTLQRARRFCAAVSPQWCCYCGAIVPEGSGNECSSCRADLEGAFAEFENWKKQKDANDPR
jgi:hypothetical protein